METNGFRSFTAGNQGEKSLYRKMLFVLLIVTMMLASFPVVRVFAAPPHDPPIPEESELEQLWADERSQLATEMTFFVNFRPIPGRSVNPANQGRHLDMYRAAIYAAQTLVVNQTGFDDEGHVINQKLAYEAVQELADYLDRIRGLKEKLGAGTTVTTTSQSTSSDEAALNLGIEKEWAAKQGQFSAEIASFIHFRTKPGRSGNDVNQGKYLDKYRGAIIIAQAIVTNHDGFDASGDVVDADLASQSIKQLADALRMIRGLKEKLGGGGQQ